MLPPLTTKHDFSETELIAPYRCGRYPPEVRTAIPVDGRFEHIILSCNATSDHAIIWIEKEAGKALEVSKASFRAFSSFPFDFSLYVVGGILFLWHSRHLYL